MENDTPTLVEWLEPEERRREPEASRERRGGGQADAVTVTVGRKLVFRLTDGQKATIAI